MLNRQPNPTNMIASNQPMNALRVPNPTNAQEGLSGGPVACLRRVARMLANARASRQEAFGKGLTRALGLESSAGYHLQNLAGEENANALQGAWENSFEENPLRLRIWEYFLMFLEAQTLSERAEENARKTRRGLRASQHEFNRILQQTR